jgi:hypothetical protein
VFLGAQLRSTVQLPMATIARSMSSMAATNSMATTLCTISAACIFLGAHTVEWEHQHIATHRNRREGKRAVPSRQSCAFIEL